MQCEKDIRGCFQAGAKRVSIDFTEGAHVPVSIPYLTVITSKSKTQLANLHLIILTGRLALRNDPKNSWTSASLLDRFIKLNNQYVSGGAVGRLAM